jgi:hypothetical protein
LMNLIECSSVFLGVLHKTGDHFCATRTDKLVIFSMWALCDCRDKFLVTAKL